MTAKMATKETTRSIATTATTTTRKATPGTSAQEEVPLWPEDTAGEQAARTLFRRLDRDGSGYAHQEEA